MKDCLLRALMFAAVVSIGEMAFCEDQPGKQTTAQDGYFEVPLPAKLFEGNPEELTFQWIDFYRN